MKKKTHDLIESETDWLENTYDALEAIDCIALEMGGIGTAFYTTGNDSMDETMHIMSRALHRSVDKIRKAVGGHVSDDCKRAGEATTNILMACLAGVKLSENAKADKLSFYGG